MTAEPGPEPRRADPRPEHLAPYAGRVLDPGTAVRFAGQRLQATVYAGGRLLVRPTAEREAILQTVARAADHHGLDIAVNEGDERLVALAREAGIGPDEPQPLVLRVELLPRFDSGPAAPPDAWPVLQTYRDLVATGSPEQAAVHLEHLLTSHTVNFVPPPGQPDGPRASGGVGTPYWSIPGTGNPYWAIPGTGNPYWSIPSDLSQYASPGWGGRTPAVWVGPDPARVPDDQLGVRRPVVAVVDTGIGEHPWLPNDIVDRHPYVGGLPIGITDPATNPENPLVTINPLVGGLDLTAGHGTFIAGLIRQTCPDADLLAVRVIQGDGIVSEADLLEALNKLWLRQRIALLQDRPEDLIDIVSLSLGYYHEEPGDAAFDPLLLAPLRALAALGVAVVASAGNDATYRPMYPAAFSPWPGGLLTEPQAEELPIIAVGATNPDGSIALFSNVGPWVRAYRPGVSLLSTLPPFDASRSATIEVSQGGTIRTTLDPDDFRSGFGLWSGTSFASPILAGELAAALLSDRRRPTAAAADSPVDRAWSLISALVPSLRRPVPPSATEEDDHGD